MDWNWFFSSIAQSVAAIVGIFSAFIITKVINNQTEFNRKSNLLSNLIVESETLKQEASIRYFSWYNNRIYDQVADKIKRDSEKINVIPSPEEYYDNYLFSPFDTRDRILPLLIKLRVDLETNLESRKNNTLLWNLAKATSVMPLSINPRIQEERELIDQLLIKVEKHCKYVRNFLNENENNPESSELVNMALVMTFVLFFSGVIYPLSFLPIDTHNNLGLSLKMFLVILFSLKGLLLLITGLLFTVILTQFLYVNNNLKYNKEIIESLKHYGDPDSYSEYFRNRKINNEHLRALKKTEPQNHS